jgi:hypothetical protein
MMSLREKRELLIDTVVEQLIIQGTSGRIITESS